jgi:type IV secretion system protein VirD4
MPAPHLLTIAPARQGRRHHHPQSARLSVRVVCIDPKGENARIAARQRGKFGAVHVLDPFGVTGLASAAFNRSIVSTPPASISPTTA